MEILYLGLTAGAVYLAWQTGLLDQAGQQLVQATAKKQPAGWAKSKARHPKTITILEQPLTVPSHPKRIRMTIA